MAMLPRADLNSPRPRTTVDATAPVAPAGDARQEVFRRLTQIAVGKELQATVASMLDDGTFLVKVADTTARMALPPGTKAGDVLSMTFLAREPRPTFLLNREAGSAPASLSDTARLIGTALHTAEQQGKPTAVKPQTPLLSAPATDPQQLASALREGLDQSGLFYESHLHEWSSGSRSLDDIKREPQAQQAGLKPGAQENGAGQRLLIQAGESANGADKPVLLPKDAQLLTAGTRATDADVVARNDMLAPVIDPEAARMISLQLNTLETHQMRWQGELWPGQPMEWEVGEDKPEPGPAGTQEPVWNSKVRFELPHLGGVSASIRLVGGSVQVHVDVDNEAAADALRRHGRGLAERIEASGASLESFLVKRDEQA
jgi:hypothetical protein